MPAFVVQRRSLLGALLSGAAAVGLPLVTRPAWGMASSGATLSDGVLTIEINPAFQTRLSHGGRVISNFCAADALHPVGAAIINAFTLVRHDRSPVSGPHGAGTRHVLTATTPGTIELERAVTFLDRYPGVAIIETRYRNRGDRLIALAGWHVAMHDLAGHRDGAWSFSGASYPDRRDAVLPVAAGFQQRNFMGMNGSDYGGGTPIAVVWQRDIGLAVAHLETVPKLVAFPVSAVPGGTRLGMASDGATVIAAGATLELPMALVAAQPGDHFAPLDIYRRIMAERGLSAPRIPRTSYGPIWCAWGYERNYTPDQVVGTLGKARSLGFEWAVLDDGWQSSVGDWQLDPVKYPRGDADMQAFVARIRQTGMRPRLWLAPLAASADTDVVRHHPDMLLLDENGATQNVSWWSAFTLCPAYQPTIDHFRGIVRRIIGDWGYDGLKLDGQHLNGVAPCYNPAHNHARPEDSFEKLQDFWKALYDEAVRINPDAVVEICPCGDSFAFHNIPAMNNTPASDPTSSWQVRLKGKSYKALIGPAAPYSGDHVELSDGQDDFASTYGIGGIPSSKFTWPKDNDHPVEKQPVGGYRLTPAKEALWRKWIDLYQAQRLAEGDYLGGLYDIGFDKPEAHVVRKAGVMHYAFFADAWDGPIGLRGLDDRAYRLSDGFTGDALGTVHGHGAVLAAKFARFLLVRATPLDHAA